MSHLEGLSIGHRLDFGNGHLVFVLEILSNLHECDTIVFIFVVKLSKFDQPCCEVL